MYTCTHSGSHGRFLEMSIKGCTPYFEGMMLPSNVVPFQNGSGGGNGVFRSMQVTPSSSTPYSDATQVSSYYTNKL